MFDFGFYQAEIDQLLEGPAPLVRAVPVGAAIGLVVDLLNGREGPYLEGEELGASPAEYAAFAVWSVQLTYGWEAGWHDGRIFGFCIKWGISPRNLVKEVYWDLIEVRRRDLG